MAHGFSATKWHGLERAAQAFAEAGFVVLLHDHRSWGNSDGNPRQDIDPWRQIDDWRLAITFLEGLDFVNAKRIGIWGTSFSGGHAVAFPRPFFGLAQLECFGQPVEDDFMSVGQRTRLTMILGAIFARETKQRFRLPSIGTTI